MFRAWLVVSVLPWVCGAATLEPDDPLEYVGKMLDYGNGEMSRRKLQFLPFQDRDWDFVVGELRLRAIRLGNMSTLALLGPVDDQKFVLRPSPGPSAAKVYDFDLKVGLRNMRMWMGYKLEMLYFADTGWLALAGEKNALRLRGSLTIYPDRRCHAQLDWLCLGVFAGFTDLRLGPVSWGHRVTARATLLALQNGLILYQDLLDQALRAYLLHNELFLAYLQEFMCYPFVVG